MVYNLNKFSIKLIKMTIDGKVAINSINEVIQTINDKKATVADYDRVIKRYTELRDVCFQLLTHEASKKSEEVSISIGFSGPPLSVKIGSTYSAIVLVFEPDQRVPIKTIVPMARDKLIEAVRSFTQELISESPELEIIQNSVNKFVSALSD